MKLAKAQIKNFRSVWDSGEFTLDPAVTCLVGKNESGKTAVLQALEKVNALEPSNADFTNLDFPRSGLTDFRNRKDDDQVGAVITEWELGTEDIAAVEEVVGEKVLRGTSVGITRGYFDTTLWNVRRNDKQAVKNLLQEAELHDEERKPLAEQKTIESVRDFLASKESGEGGLSPREKAVAAVIKEKYGTGSVWKAIVDVLKSRLPKMVYFGSYLRMPGQVSINDLNKRAGAGEEPGNEVFLALLDLNGRSPKELEDIGVFDLMQAELEGASNKLTKEIFRYWTQNRHLKVQFRFEQALPGDPAPFNAGYVMRTRIENQRHGVTTSFDDRSAGFVWFFSFLVWFSQARKNYGKKLVLLLDEPGLSLHAKAQEDLLRYFEERLGDFQVVYTTHSPFMVDPKRLLRARTVEDRFIESNDPFGEDEDLGTIVGDRTLSTDRDTLFPLQAALGYDITQTLFVGEYCLLVEGPSELLYLPWFSRKLMSLGRTGLDRRWTLTPCGGIDKISTFLSLLSGQQLHIAAFVDFAEGGRKRVRSLRESALLSDGHLLSAEAFADQPEADTEDLLGREAYVSLVNDCYQLKVKERLPKKKAADAPDRVVKEVEAHFRVKATSADEFDHYRPSAYLT